MYSVLNVDVSILPSQFNQQVVIYKSGNSFVAYNYKTVISGSSSVNGDSAHSTDPLARQHNYVSFYIHSIEVKYETYFTGDISRYKYPLYIILFKIPYKDYQDTVSQLITNTIGGMILYSHPECVLAYDVIHYGINSSNKTTKPRLLQCKKPFVLRPNDYVGIFYYFPIGDVWRYISGVNGSAKIVFKPQ